MLDFSSFVDLPLVWGLIIALGVFIYVLLDGFDLGIGILFPFAPTDKCRDRMMNSIAPFWDGNETWLILGGGGLFAAFPLAYSIIMPAFYIPIILMLLGLIFRGVAFEFRFKTSKEFVYLWDYAFHIGSLTAAFMQGVILGGFVSGIKVENNAFSGGSYDWLSAFSVMTGMAVVVGYALIGSTWMIMKSTDETEAWARSAAKYSLIHVSFFLFLVSIVMPSVRSEIYDLWFSIPNFFYLLPIPMLTAFTVLGIWFGVSRNKECSPFFFTMFLFLLAYVGLAISILPYIVPYQVTLREASAAATSQSLLLVGTVFLIPLILIYTGYCYWVFRGKANQDGYYGH